MYLLIDDQSKEMIITESVFELKEYVLKYLFNHKTDLILDARLQKLYEEIVNDLFVAEDDEDVQRCLNAINVYYNRRLWIK